MNYTFRNGLPYPTFDDGAPASLEIIGMCPAVAYEKDRFQGTVPLGDPPGSLSGLPDLPDGLRSECDADGRRPRYGSGMMATFPRGRGAVFNAGASQWVAGLMHGDWFVERISQQATRRPSGAVRNGWGSRHRASANGQRDSKMQPAGGSTRSGTRPEMCGRRRFVPPPSPGTQARSPFA